MRQSGAALSARFSSFQCPSVPLPRSSTQLGACRSPCARREEGERRRRCRARFGLPRPVRTCQLNCKTDALDGHCLLGCRPKALASPFRHGCALIASTRTKAPTCTFNPPSPLHEVANGARGVSHRYTSLGGEVIDVRMQCHPDGMRAVGQALKCGRRRDERHSRRDSANACGSRCECENALHVHFAIAGRCVSGVRTEANHLQPQNRAMPPVAPNLCRRMPAPGT